MPTRDVVVIGASAGGLGALSTIVSSLPRALPACVLVVVHSSPSGGTVLPQILRRLSDLPVEFASEGHPLTHGHVYVARADHHLMIRGQRMTLGHGPRENGFRPAIDPLFRTAARELGSRVIGVILSGALSDGTYGLSAVKRHGGMAIVQDPRDAIVDRMPLNAMNAVSVDHVLSAGDIGAMIDRLVRTGGRQGASPMPRKKPRLEPQLADHASEVADMTALFGPPSGLTCPDCGGALWEVQEGQLLRYQCHVGHQYAPENLDDEQRDAIDSALWSAVRVLEEHADLKSRMATRAAGKGLQAVSAGFVQGAVDARAQAESIRALLMTPSPSGNGRRARRTQRVAVSRRARAKSGRKRQES